MTLTLALNLPDGIVLAADSLQTITAEENAVLTLKTKCKHCGKEDGGNIQIPRNNNFPGSPYCQKLFNLKGNKGILLDSLAFINGRTIESYIREFDFKLNDDSLSVVEVSEKLIAFLSSILSTNGINNANIGFQLAGFDNDFKGKIISANVGIKCKKETIEDLRLSWRGYNLIINKLLSKLKDETTKQIIPEPTPDLRFMTIQDGIDYALFFLRTTIDYQRFAIMNKTVGGAIDIAIITPHAGFEWIQKKELRDENGVSQMRKDNVDSRLLKQIAGHLSGANKIITPVEISTKELIK